MFTNPALLTAARLGLLRGLIHTQAAMESPPANLSANPQVLKTNRSDGLRLLRDGIGVGNEPYLVALARTVDQNLLEFEKPDDSPMHFTKHPFHLHNRMIGALIGLVPLHLASPVYPSDFLDRVPFVHRQSSGALAVYLDKYLLFLAENGSMAGALMRAFADRFH